MRGQRQVLGGLVADLGLLGGSYGSAASVAAMLYIENSHLFTGFDSLKSAIGAILTPTNLMIGGLAGLAVGGALAYLSVKQTALAFDDASKSIGTTASELHALDSLGVGKGIDTTDFLAAMTKFGTSVYDAKANMGGLSELMNANGQSASTFTQYLEKAADLIKNCSSDQQRLQLLQQMGLPATMDWVRFLSSGSDGIKEAIKNATGFGDAAEQAMVAKARAFDEAWATTWKNFKSGAQSAVISAGGWLNTLSQYGTKGLMALGVNVPKNLLSAAMNGGSTANAPLTTTSNVNSFYAGTGAGNGPAGPAKTTVDPAVVQKQISDQQQYIAMLGSTASAEQAVQQVQLARQAASIKGINITNQQETALENLARANAIGTTAIKAQTDAANVETATVGMSVGAAAQYAAAQNAINAARQKGMPLTAADIASIRQESSALGQASQTADDLKWSYTNLVQGPLQAFATALENGSNWFDALKKSGISALNSIASKLMDMAAQNLWKAAFGGATSGSGGILAMLGLGGVGATGAVNADGSIQGAVGATSVGGAALVGFADGGYTGNGSANQPAGIVHAGEYVMDAVSTSRLGVPYLNSLRGYASGGYVDSVPNLPMARSVSGGGAAANARTAAGTPSVVIQNTNYFSGSDPGSEARMRSYVDQSSKQAVSQAVQAVSAIKATTPSYLRVSR